MKNSIIVAWAAGFGFTAVILGALGAHALKSILTPDDLEAFETAVRYQMWHAIVLLILGLAPLKLKFLKAAVYCFIIGILLFSGSIYLLSTSELSGTHWSFLGPVTPLGGLLMIIAWLLVLFSAFSVKNTLTN